MLSSLERFFFFFFGPSSLLIPVFPACNLRLSFSALYLLFASGVGGGEVEFHPALGGRGEPSVRDFYMRDSYAFLPPIHAIVLFEPPCLA